jgi:hypothetical protein
MDPALERLVVDEACRIGGSQYNPASGFSRCQPDNLAWAKLVSQYGGAIGATAMHSARTTGYGGFELGFEGAYTTIDSQADYWKRGSQGPIDRNTNFASSSNTSVDPVLQTYLFKFRKGFPLGFELSTAVGFVANTSMFVGGADVRWSIFEGFRTGIPAYFPEFAIGGSVRTITGVEAMQLTVASADAQLSKPFPIAGSVVVTPYVGYQPMFIFGDSGTMDLTPNTDAVDLCGFQGPNTPVTPGAGSDNFDGQPVCSGDAGATSADFNNNIVFDPVRLTRHRLHFGTQLRVSAIKVGAHVATDVVTAAQANQRDVDQVKDANGNVVGNRFDGVGNQWTIAVDVGAVF